MLQSNIASCKSYLQILSVIHTFKGGKSKGYKEKERMKNRGKNKAKQGGIKKIFKGGRGKEEKDERGGGKKP